MSETHRMEEEWRPIPEFSDYQVSNLGRVRSYRRRERALMLKPYPNVSVGYLEVKMHDDFGGWRAAYVHRCVAASFIRPLIVGDIVNHVDGDRANNALDNLEICTVAINRQHAILTRWVHAAVEQALKQMLPRMLQEYAASVANQLPSEKA